MVITKTHYDAGKRVRKQSLEGGFNEVQWVETINEGDFATHVKWDVTGEWSDSVNPATLIFSTGAIGGTLKQTIANMASSWLAGEVYRVVYTIAVTTAPNGDFTLQLVGGAIPVDMPYTAATHTIYVLVGSTPGDFTITATETTATEGSISIDDISSIKVLDNVLDTATDEWHMVQAVEGAATFSATSIVGDDLTSLELAESQIIQGRFSRIIPTAGKILAYRL